MPAYSALKQSACKKCTKGLVAMCGIFIALFLVLSASILSPALSSRSPFHAECEVNWKWTNTNCSTVHKALRDQVLAWKGPRNCEHGGEKCLYELISDSENKMELTHTTPVRKYVDDVSFNFCGPIDSHDCSNGKVKMSRPKREVKLMKKIFVQSDKGCAVSGFSRSEAWYAVLDSGTNYCNMRNLVDGAGLSQYVDFSEETDDDMCTQYSSADCGTY